MVKDRFGEICSNGRKQHSIFDLHEGAGSKIPALSASTIGSLATTDQQVTRWQRTHRKKTDSRWRVYTPDPAVEDRRPCCDKQHLADGIGFPPITSSLRYPLTRPRVKKARGEPERMASTIRATDKATSNPLSARHSYNAGEYRRKREILTVHLAAIAALLYWLSLSKARVSRPAFKNTLVGKLPTSFPQ